MPNSQQPKSASNASLGCLFFLLFVIPFIISSCLASFVHKNPAEEAKEKQAEIEEWLTSGAKYSCINSLKRQLRDPESYQDDGAFQVDPPKPVAGDPAHKETTILWTFRSKNGFGGYNTGIATCAASTADGGTVQATAISN